MALAILVTAGLHVALPAQYRVQPRWVVPAVLVGLLAVLIIGDPGRIDQQKPWLRLVTGIVIAFITVTNLFAAVLLVRDIITNDKVFANNATGLLATGGVIWVTNVIAFALWYWDLDRGAPPRARTIRTRTRRSSSRRCCTPTTRRPPGSRGSSTNGARTGRSRGCRGATGRPPLAPGNRPGGRCTSSQQ